MSPNERTTRRTLLATAGAAIGGLAGCSTSREDGAGGGSGTTETIPEDTLPTPVAGDADADVTVAVYKDFACSHCRTFNEEVYPKLKSEYIEPGSIRYEHHDFPVPVDQTVSWQAPSAARAVQVTVGVDAFFEYADLLFANQPSLGPETYASLASEVGADGETVRTAATERRYDPTVKADRQRGIEAGVRGTPTAFVDGQKVEATYEALSSAIDEA